ncbi:COX15/CtaA family protein [Acidocella sp.]|uniref:COX15/CtaA family protein n=1 Tax=Acidocella sp. TaxID=50710 RepID=UPI00261922B9|nr:COX15/CtaA family protein [Acidocella sp.]
MPPSTNPQVPGSQAGSPRNRRLVAAWLFLLAFMIWIMAGIGGYTRDTGSGLSIMDWDPIMGTLPPLSAAAWNAVFAKYQTISQYKLLHHGMNLAGFKQIFWPEYIHRLWGRLMGVVLLVPLIAFAATGRIEKRLIPWLVLLFILGGLQGAIGWFMVSSGFFANSVAVEPWRLSLHFFAAMFLLGAVLWTALTVQSPSPACHPHTRTLRRLTLAAFLLLLLAMFGGTFVSGIHGITAFDPAKGIGTGQPPAGWPFSGIFSDTATIIFDHQLLAVIATLAILTVTVQTLRRGAPAPVRDAALAAGGLVILQFLLGFAALMSKMLDLGVVHQMNAILLLGCLLLLLHRLRGATP